MSEQAYGADGHPIEQSFGQTGFPSDSIAETALGRLGGAKSSLPIQPAPIPQDSPSYSPYQAGFKNSFEWLNRLNLHPLQTILAPLGGLQPHKPQPAGKEVNDFLSGLPPTAPIAAYTRGESAAPPTGALGGQAIQAGIGAMMARSPVSGEAVAQAKRSMPIYGEPAPAPSMGNTALNYGISQVNKVPFMPNIGPVKPKISRPFVGYMDPAQEAGIGNATVQMPPRTVSPEFNSANPVVQSGAGGPDISPPFVGDPDVAIGNAPKQPLPTKTVPPSTDKRWNTKNPTTTDQLGAPLDAPSSELAKKFADLAEAMGKKGAKISGASPEVQALYAKLQALLAAKTGNLPNTGGW